MIDGEATQRYVQQHFWTIDEVADAVGMPTQRVLDLMSAGCAPGPVYIVGADGWWSALDRSKRPAPVGRAWYSRGSAWTLRRALLALRNGSSEHEVSAVLEQSFARAFTQALRVTAHADVAFANCFVDGIVHEEAAYQAAKPEWRSWIEGGYAVCLRTFTGATCVAKESLAASIKADLARNNYDAPDLLAKAEQLADLILPFAPWQRPTGTPGRTIDQLLLEQGLGRERPYDRTAVPNMG